MIVNRNKLNNNINRNISLTEALIYSLNEAQTSLEKQQQTYKDYINEHVENVKKAWDIIKTLDNKWINEYSDEIEENINKHDESKWSEEEFEPYRMKYYPVNDEEKVNAEAEFEPAWNHHYKNNPHHWQYWLTDDFKLDEGRHNKDKIDPKIMIAYVEMICDWAAMSMKFNNKVDEWYNSNKDNMILWKNEQKELEKIIKLYMKEISE